MKKTSYIFLILFAISIYNNAITQTTGTIWIKTFRPGSTNLNDPQIDKSALATLDSLMQHENIKVTFLGAADGLKWNLNGKKVHDNVSEALNDAKRLSRARVLRERYKRGIVGITHENIAGVKVIWAYKNNNDIYTDVKQLDEQNKAIKQELDDLKTNMQNLRNGAHATNGQNGTNGTNGKNGHSKNEINEGLTFNWRLQTGLWTWQSGSNGSILSPSLALNIIIGKTSFVIQGGVTPWHSSTAYGNQSESFVYSGLKYMNSNVFGLTAGVFRGWEFFTSTDDWAFKTTGLSTGVVLTYRRIEFNPMLTFSNISSIEKSAAWKLGSILGVNVNIN